MTLLRAHDMGDLAILVPYLLGYHPGRSFVLLAHINGQIGPILRVELDPVPRGPISVQGGDPAVVRGLQAVAEPAERILAIAFEEVEGESHGWDLALRALGAELGVRIEPTVRVRDGRWYWVDGLTEEGSFESEGGSLPDTASLAGVAELVLQGRAPLKAREDLLTLVRHEDEHVESVGLALARLRGGAGAFGSRIDPRPGTRHRYSPIDLRRGLQAWASLLAPHSASGQAPPGELDRSTPPDPRTVAEAVWSLQNLELRDAIISWVAPAYGLPAHRVSRRLRQPLQETLTRVRSADRVAIEQRLILVCQSTPYEDRVPALTILAVHAWSYGNGSLARVAAAEALLIDPDYTLAKLVASMIEGIVRLPLTGGTSANDATLAAHQTGLEVAGELSW